MKEIEKERDDEYHISVPGAQTKNSEVKAGTYLFYMFSLAIIGGSSPQLQTK